MPRKRTSPDPDAILRRNVRLLMADRDLNRARLAELMDMSEDMVQQRQSPSAGPGEKSRARWRTHEIVQLARLFDVDPGWFLVDHVVVPGKTGTSRNKVYYSGMSGILPGTAEPIPA